MKTKSLDNADSALMLSYAAGESEGFELLYRRHKAAVFKFFYFGTNGNTSLATELFQDVWMTVVRGRTRYTVEMRFVDWLHHVAWARLYDHIRLHPAESDKNTSEIPRSEIREFAIPLPANVLRFSPPKEEAVIALQEDELLLGQLRKMPEDHREIVLLRYCLRMEFSEIADFLDVARSSVSQMHREVLASLRSNLPEAC